MSNDNVKEYKSENPLVQKCLDILDKPGIKIKKNGLIFEVWLDDKKFFGIGDSNGPLFINCFTFFNISNKDVGMLVKKCKEVMNALEIKAYQYALYWLEQEPKAKTAVPTKPTFGQKLKKFFQRERE